MTSICRLTEPGMTVILTMSVLTLSIAAVALMRACRASPS